MPLIPLLRLWDSRPRLFLPVFLIFSLWDSRPRLFLPVFRIFSAVGQPPPAVFDEAVPMAGCPSLDAREEIAGGGCPT